MVSLSSSLGSTRGIILTHTRTRVLTGARTRTRIFDLVPVMDLVDGPSSFSFEWNQWKRHWNDVSRIEKYHLCVYSERHRSRHVPPWSYLRPQDLFRSLVNGADLNCMSAKPTTRASRSRRDLEYTRTEFAEFLRSISNGRIFSIEFEVNKAYNTYFMLIWRK